MGTTREFCELFWTNPGNNNPRNNSCSASYLPSQKPSKMNKKYGTLLEKQGRTYKWLLLWTPTHGWASVGRAAGTYLQRLYADTGCNLEDLPGAMEDRNAERERERVREICAAADDDDDEYLV